LPRLVGEPEQRERKRSCACLHSNDPKEAANVQELQAGRQISLRNVSQMLTDAELAARDGEARVERQAELSAVSHYLQDNLTHPGDV